MPTSNNVASFKTAVFERDMQTAITNAALALAAFNQAAHQRIAQITEAKSLAHGTSASAATKSPEIAAAAAAFVDAILALQAVE